MDILEILKKYGLELSEESKSEFDKDFRKSFKSAAELQKVKTELSTVQADLDKANETIENSKALNTQSADAEKQYKEEIEKYKSELAEIKFKSLLDAELNGIEFSSERVKSSIVADIKSKGFEEKDGKLTGLSEYMKELYENEPQSFKSVDDSIHTWGSSTSNQKETKAVKEDWETMIF